MFVVIFGRPGCPYCVRAKNLAEKLKGEVADFDYRYVDIIAEGISKQIYQNLSVKKWKLCHKSLLMKNQSAVALISKH